MTANPDMPLEAIPQNDEMTQPLSPEQFGRMSAAIDPFTETAGFVGECAKELSALCLLQRWALVRILDYFLPLRTLSEPAFSIRKHQ